MRVTYLDGFYWANENPGDKWTQHANGAWYTADIAIALAQWDDMDVNTKKPIDLLYTAQYLGRRAKHESLPKLHQDLVIPAGKELRPYQTIGAWLLRHLPVAYLADPVGSGKTVQACVAINSLVTPAVDILIICPKSALYVWEQHLKDWCGVHVNVHTTSGSIPYGRIVVTTFDLARLTVAALSERRWDLLIVDEAAYVKSAQAKRTQAILGDIAPRCSRTWFLSGTPTPNGRPVELWPILASTEPSGFPRSELPWLGYTRKYCEAYQDDKEWNTRGAANLDELHWRLRCGFMIARTDEQISDQKPALVETIVPIENDSALLEAEKPFRAAWEIANATNTLKEWIGAALGDYAKLRQIIGLAKVNAAVEMAREALENGTHVLIFGHHISVVQKIAEELHCSSITGSVSAKERKRIEEIFQQSEHPVALVGNQAMREALTFSRAALVILVEPSWVPGENLQFIGRAWRFGNKAATVTARYLVLRGSLDDLIITRNLEKSENISTILHGVENMLG